MPSKFHCIKLQPKSKSEPLLHPCMHSSVTKVRILADSSLFKQMQMALDGKEIVQKLPGKALLVDDGLSSPQFMRADNIIFKQLFRGSVTKRDWDAGGCRADRHHFRLWGVDCTRKKQASRAVRRLACPRSP